MLRSKRLPGFCQGRGVWSCHPPERLRLFSGTSGKTAQSTGINSRKIVGRSASTSRAHCSGWWIWVLRERSEHHGPRPCVLAISCCNAKKPYGLFLRPTASNPPTTLLSVPCANPSSSAKSALAYSPPAVPSVVAECSRSPRPCGNRAEMSRSSWSRRELARRRAPTPEWLRKFELVAVMLSAPSRPLQCAKTVSGNGPRNSQDNTPF